MKNGLSNDLSVFEMVRARKIEMEFLDVEKSKIVAE